MLINQHTDFPCKDVTNKGYINLHSKSKILDIWSIIIQQSMQISFLDYTIISPSIFSRRNEKGVWDDGRRRERVWQICSSIYVVKLKFMAEPQ